MPITPELAAIYASAPVAGGYIETLEFSHSQFPFPGGVYRMTNFYKNFTGKDNDNLTDIEFLPVPFAVSMPRSDGGGQQELNIAISNVGRVLVDAIEQANTAPGEPIQATFRVYLDAGDTANQIDPIMLAITDVSIGIDYVSAVARRADVLNAPFPTELYRTDIFPGLDR